MHLLTEQDDQGCQNVEAVPYGPENSADPRQQKMSDLPDHAASLTTGFTRKLDTRGNVPPPSPVTVPRMNLAR